MDEAERLRRARDSQAFVPPMMANFSRCGKSIFIAWQGRAVHE
jgi:hypothetical protein